MYTDHYTKDGKDIGKYFQMWQFRNGKSVPATQCAATLRYITGMQDELLIYKSKQKAKNYYVIGMFWLPRARN